MQQKNIVVLILAVKERVRMKLIKKCLQVLLLMMGFPLLVITDVNALSENNKDALKALYVDFDTSMHLGYSPEDFVKYIKIKPQRADIPYLKDLYETNNFLKKIEQLQETTITSTIKIPKIIHQIWLGSAFPEQYKKYQESWLRIHPDWEYRLWTDADLVAFKLVNQEAFDKGRTWAEKANIFRYEIIERFGGVYVDTDFEALQPLDIIHENYEFYAGITAINRIGLINNAIIGAIPHHPILKKCIADIDTKKYGQDQMRSTGTIYFSYTTVGLCRDNPDFNVGAVLILPPTYLYPSSDFLLPSSFAIHYFAEKWNGFGKK